MNKLLLALGFLIFTHASSFGISVLTFDQNDGTRSWVEDSRLWLYDDNSYDYISTMNPFGGNGGSGLCETNLTPSRLYTDGLLNLNNIKILVANPGSILSLSLKGLDINGNVLYNVPLNPYNYSSFYNTVTLGWTNVKFFTVDLVTDGGYSQVFYDDLQYTVTQDVTPPTINCPTNIYVCNNVMPDLSTFVTATDENGIHYFDQGFNIGIEFYNIPEIVDISVYDSSSNFNSCLVNVYPNSYSSSTITETACNYYMFNGDTLTQSGIFIDTIANSNNCDSIIHLNLTIENFTPQIVVAGNPNGCQGDSIILIAEGGTNFNWSANNGFLSINDSLIVTSTNQFSLYDCIISNGTCSDTLSQSVSLTKLGDISTNFTSVFCAGEEIVFNFNYYNGVTPNNPFWDMDDGTTLSNTLSVQKSYSTNGTYDVTFTADFGNCGSRTFHKEIIISSSASPVAGIFVAGATFNGDTIYACPGDSVQFTSAQQTAQTYSWNLGGNGTTTNVPYKNYVMGGNGQYILNFGLTNNCGNYEGKSYIVKVGGQLPVTTSGINTNSQFCNTVYFNPNTNNKNYTYSWDFGDGVTQTEDSPIHTYVNSGDYTVTLYTTNNCGVTQTETQPVYASSGIYILASTDSACMNENIRFELNQSLQNPVWSFGDGSPASNEWATTHSFQNNGFYTVTLNATINNCPLNTFTTQVYIGNNARPESNFDISDNNFIVCVGDEIKLRPYSLKDNSVFIWNFGDGSGNFATYDTIVKYSTPGTYNVSLTVNNICGVSASSTKQITVVTSGENFSDLNNYNFGYSYAGCKQVNFYNTQVSASSYSWNFGDGNLSNETEPRHQYLNAGTYSVSLSATNGCGYTYTNNQPITIQNSSFSNFSTEFSNQTAICPGDKIFYNLQINEDDVDTIIWSFGDGSTNNNTRGEHIYNIAGTYNAQLYFKHKCYGDTTITYTVEVSSNAPAIVKFFENIFVFPGISCTNDQVLFAAVNKTGSYTYVFDFGNGRIDTAQFTQHIENFGYLYSINNAYQDTGTYNVIVTAINSCGSIAKDTAQIHITNSGGNPAGEMLLADPFITTCKPANFLASGGVYFNWNFGDGTLINNGSANETHTYADTGTYYAVVEIINGCGDTVISGQNIIVKECTQPPCNFTASVSKINPTCGENNGSINIIPNGGIAPYTVNINGNVFTSLNFSGLGNGVYNAIITDSIGCSDTISTTLTGPFALAAVINKTAAACNQAIGSATALVNGGTPPYNYLWTNGSQLANVDSLLPGQYSLQITDSAGCFINKTINIISSNGPNLVAPVTNVKCFGGNDGAISLNILGGAPPFKIKWSTGDTIQNLINLTAGIYDVEVTDAQGCIAINDYEVEQPAKLILTFTKTNADCGLTNGSITANVNGGTSPYSYQWSAEANNATTQTVTNIQAGIYSVSVTDNKNCVITRPVALSTNNGPVISGEVSNLSSCGSISNGSINVSISGGTQPYTYSWNTGDTTQDLSNLNIGLFGIQVTDAGLCKSYASFQIGIDSIPLLPEICLVTVDTTTGTNQIVYERSHNPRVTGYNFYRETSQTNVYNFVGTLSQNDEGLFTDSIANPFYRSWKYKITAIDSCGNETQRSVTHKTIHMQANLGLANAINLSWDNYQGFNYNTYFIWRHTIQNGWELLDSVPSNINTYSDIPPATGQLKYFIEIRKDSDCDPSRARIATSRSNVKNSSRTMDTVTVVANHKPFSFSATPNPTKNIVTLNFGGKLYLDIDMEIIDIKGSVVYGSYNKSNFGSPLQVDVKNLAQGIYFLKVNADNYSKVIKLIKE